MTSDLDVLSALSPSYANQISQVSSATLRGGAGLSAAASPFTAGPQAYAPTALPPISTQYRLFAQGWNGGQFQPGPKLW